jgi:hypothetical protein
MSKSILFLLLIVPLKLLGQEETQKHKHFGSMEIGGQMFISLNYEYSLLQKEFFILNTNFCLGINNFADETSGSPGIKGIHTGFICLLGRGLLHLELGFNPSTYFFGSNTFVNLNGSVGIRISPKKMSGIFFFLGYTPKIYSTFSDNNHNFFPAAAGLKMGVNF